jgi:hypothetical protein
MSSPLTATAVTTAVLGDNIPAHDETLDLAEVIGQKLDEFREYIVTVRNREQADAAVVELLTALLEEAKVGTTNTETA